MSSTSISTPGFVMATNNAQLELGYRRSSAVILASIEPGSRYCALRRVAEDRGAAACLIFLLIVRALSLLCPLLSPYPPTFVHPVARKLPPSWSHWFGTDD